MLKLSETILMKKTVKELKDICREYELKGWSKLKKKELMQFIRVKTKDLSNPSKITTSMSCGKDISTLLDLVKLIKNND